MSRTRLIFGRPPWHLPERFLSPDCRGCGATPTRLAAWRLVSVPSSGMAPISSAARTGPRTKDQSIIKELTALRRTLIISLSELKSLKARMGTAVAAKTIATPERRVLRRRSQKDRLHVAADREAGYPTFSRNPASFIPGPSDRFAVKHPRWEPYAGNQPVRICAGGAQGLPPSTVLDGTGDAYSNGCPYRDPTAGGGENILTHPGNNTPETRLPGSGRRFEPPHGEIRKIRWLELHERRKAETDALKVATNALEGCRCPNS